MPAGASEISPVHPVWLYTGFDLVTQTTTGKTFGATFPAAL